MNILSLLFVIGLLASIPYAVYINAMRTGRKSNGQFLGIVKKQLFYSELRNT